MKDQNRNITRCVRNQTREYLSRKTIFAFILFLLTIFGVQPLEAQRAPFSHQKESSRTHGHGAFWQSSSLGLNEAQIKALENIREAFVTEAIPLWHEIKILNLEIRDLISDPNAKTKDLFDRQRRISELGTKLETLLLSSKVKARSVLTKKQTDRLPQNSPLGMGTVFEADTWMDWGLQRGVRY
jgi:Spy/CpxP family protein refolding chaperone